MTDDTRHFLAHLHRGGAYAYWWTSEGKQSAWWEVESPAPLFDGRRNIYFGIHPTDQIPETNRRGEPRPPARVRSQIAHIAAVNCLFAEFDAKDYGGDLAATLAHIETLKPRPSVVIASGGGYHCYWLLKSSWLLPDDDARLEAARVQERWVSRVGGDNGAKDLARVLRVPGTHNYKYTPARAVEYVWCDLGRTYERSVLIALLPDAETPRAISGPQPTDRTEEWARRKLGDAIRMVATAGSGARHTVLLKAARLAGGCVPHLDAAEIVRALTAAAPGGWEDDREVERVILDGVAYGAAAPLAPPKTPRALVWRAAETTAPAGVAVDREWREEDEDRPIYVVGPTPPHGITSLTTVPPPPVVWFAPGFIREGLGLIVGQPNVGKTPLAAQFALAAAAGVRWMDAVAVEPCKVLYLGCEYSKQELYPLLTESIGAMKLKVGREITDETFAYKTQDDPLPDNPDAALADLEFYVSLGFRLIIIDTLTAFLPPEKFKQNVYRGDYKELQPYHRLALKHSVAIVGVWHASKRESDPKLMYNGSTGMWAVPSSRISMYEDADGRKRISSFPRLGDRTDWALTQEKTMMGRRWVVSDAAPEPPEMGPQEKTIYQWLRANSNRANPKSPATIAEMTSIPNTSIRTVLGRMFDKNLIQGAKGSYYVETAVTPVTPVTPVTDVTLSAVTTPPFCHGLVTGTDGARTPDLGGVTDVTTLQRDAPLQPVTPGLDQIPDEKALRSAGYRWLGTAQGWYGYTPNQETTGPNPDKGAVLAWLWAHQKGEGR